MKQICYVYCARCREVTETEIRSAAPGGAEQACCGKCGTPVSSALGKKTCKICGNELLAPRELLPALPFPCHAEQDPPGQEARAPSRAPVFIRWKNPRGRWMVHQEPLAGTVEKKPLLQVGADQLAVLETAGKRVLVRPGVSSILRGGMDPRTIVWLVQSGYDPTAFFSGLASSLYFIDTKEHRFAGEAVLTLPETGVTLTVPFTLTVRLGAEQAAGLFNQALDWSSDEEVNRQLERLAADAARDLLKTVIARRLPKGGLPEPARALRAALPPRLLTDLANRLNRALYKKGLTLSRRIEIDFDAVSAEYPEPETPEAPEEQAPPEPETPPEGDFGFYRYRISPAGGAVITGFSGGIAEAVLPEEIHGRPVAEIGEDAFAQSAGLVRAVLPQRVQRIGPGAFRDCPALRTVTLPDGLSVIEEGAFARCAALEELRFGSGLTAVGENAFRECAALRTVVFSDGVKRIESSAFLGCSSLTEAEFPRGLEHIGPAAFADCRSLSRIHLPAELAFVGENAFRRCSPSLTASVSAGSFAENWCRASGIPYHTPFIWVSQGPFMELARYAGDDQVVTVPAQVQGKPVIAVNERCFQGNAALREVHLPEGLRTIGACAFSECARLTAVTLPSTLTRIDLSAFSDCVMLESVTIPGGVSSIANGLFENCRSLKKAVLSQGVRTVGTKSFYNCGSLQEIEWPATLGRIGMMAFSRCRSLTEIRLPEGLREIEPSAFAHCGGLRQAELPGSLAFIGSEAFQGCAGDFTCRVQANSPAEKWCRAQRIRTVSNRAPAAAAAPPERVCPSCGRKLPLLGGRCRFCGR